VNAILLALTLTGVVLLDYVWEHFEGRLKDKKAATIVKWVVVVILLIAGWSQAVIQYRRDSQSETDMNFLKTQLAHANEALTNSTAVVKALTTGGDYIPEIMSGLGTETNTLTFSLLSQSDYPLRSLSVSITDETQRVRVHRTNSNAVVPNKVLYQQFLGDYPTKGTTKLCEVHLDPATTNYIRVELHTLEVYQWYVLHIFKTNGQWSHKLAYSWTQIAGRRPDIEPPEMKDVLMVE